MTMTGHSGLWILCECADVGCRELFEVQVPPEVDKAFQDQTATEADSGLTLCPYCGLEAPLTQVADSPTGGGAFVAGAWRTT